MRKVEALCAVVTAIGVAGCGSGQDSGNEAAPRPVVVAAVGEPASVLPPLAVETVARDIGDLVYERLADLEPGKPPIDPTAYRPRLAERWERVDSLTWRFQLAPGARWADGEPVTAEDVRFSFDAFSDSVLDAVARPVLAGRVRVTVEDPRTFLIGFRDAYPEQLYDATYHVRILPRHIWASVPRAAWAADTVSGRLIGSGPYRVREWKRGQFLALEARDTSGRGPALRTIVWRFAQDPDAALNLVLAHEADLMELAAVPRGGARVAADTAFRLVRYPSAAYGFLGFNLADSQGRPHPVLGERATRRALAMAVDRVALARSAFDSNAVPPPGPMSRLLWIWSDQIRTLPFDPAGAARALEAGGWHRGPDGFRYRGGRRPRLRHPGTVHQLGATATRGRAASDVGQSRREGDRHLRGLFRVSGAARPAPVPETVRSPVPAPASSARAAPAGSNGRVRIWSLQSTEPETWARRAARVRVERRRPTQSTAIASARRVARSPSTGCGLAESAKG